MHLGIDALATDHARHLHHQRHADGGVVDEHRVGVLAVLREALAVVGGDDRQGSGPVPLAPPALEELTDQPVGVGHLAVVGVSVGRALRLRGCIWGVRLVQVHPQEHRALLIGKPAERRLDGLASRALLAGRGDLTAEVVVDREALVETGARGQYGGTHEGSRVVPLVRQRLGECSVLGGQGEESVAAHSVTGRVLAGEDGGVRGKRDRGRGDGLEEADTFRGHGIDVRRLHVGWVEVREAVGSGRVDRHQQYVDGCSGGRLGLRSRFR